MAKKSMLERERKRGLLVLKYESRRRALRGRVRDLSLDEAQRVAARIALNRLPRDSSAARLRNRCVVTGRPHGFYRKFGLGRNKLREHAMRGDIPGLTKASW